MSQWIRCDKELPPLDIRVLMINDGEVLIGERWYAFDDENMCDSWEWYLGEKHLGREILIKYWMPLPSIPEEKDE